MLRNTRTAVKFLVYGIVIGLLFAPQSGAELREKIFGMLGDTISDTISGGKQQ